MFFRLSNTSSYKKTTEKPTEKPTKYHDIIIDAIEEVKDCWRQHYDEPEYKSDGYFESKNTRLITIKDNEIEQFHDVSCIIEFELFTDYYGSSPYYENININDNVIVYKNGTMDVANSPIQMYRAMTFISDFSGFIESIDDYQDQYNCVEKLK